MAFTYDTVPKIYESIDFLNVMAYDLMNRRDNFTKHHSGSFDSVDALKPYNDPAIYLQDLTLGLGFYIKWFKTASNETCDRVPAIGCRTELMEDPETGADLGRAGAFSWHDGVPSELKESFERAMSDGVDEWHRGDFIGHCYLDKEKRIFWSWDTPQSITRKLEWIFERFGRHGTKQDDLGGVFAWGLGEDAPRFEHLKAVNKALEDWERKVSEHQEL